MSYERMALAVITQAMNDALADETKLKNKSKRKIRLKNKIDALLFLTVPNDDFDMWCFRANLEPTKTRNRAIYLLDNPNEWDEVLKEIENVQD